LNHCCPGEISRFTNKLDTKFVRRKGNRGDTAKTRRTAHSEDANFVICYKTDNARPDGICQAATKRLAPRRGLFRRGIAVSLWLPFSVLQDILKIHSVLFRLSELVK
jgi:hypothetical protein